MKEKTLVFKFLINIDRMFNVLTGGDIGVCFSTRSYINSVKYGGIWDKIRATIDFFFWDGHCHDSYKWECKIKREWLERNKW